MGEALKLIIGFVGVVIGGVAGFGGLMIVMHNYGEALWETPILGVLVSVGLVGGGAIAVGYLALWIIGTLETRRKRARRKSKKRRR